MFLLKETPYGDSKESWLQVTKLVTDFFPTVKFKILITDPTVRKKNMQVSRLLR